MRTVSCCLIILFVTKSPVTVVIYSLKFLIVFTFLCIDILAFSSGDRCKDKSVSKAWCLIVGC